MYLLKEIKVMLRNLVNYEFSVTTSLFLNSR